MKILGMGKEKNKIEVAVEMYTKCNAVLQEGIQEKQKEHEDLCLVEEELKSKYEAELKRLQDSFDTRREQINYTKTEIDMELEKADVFSSNLNKILTEKI